MRWLVLLLDVRGRLGRAGWWAIHLAGAAVAVALVGIDRAGILIPQGLVILVVVVLVLAAIAAGIRRLHDRGRSGWWLLLLYVVPALLDELAPAFGAAVGLVVEAAAVVLAAWAVTEIAGLPGTPGPNRYGADPRAATGMCAVS